MKAVLLLVMLGMGSVASGMSELETLRLRCADQQRQIRRLEDANAKLRAAKATPAEAGTAPTASAVTAVPEAGETHQIKDGETYVSIAKKYGVSVASLVAANPEAKPTALRPGQIIRLRAKSTGTAASPAVPEVKSTSAPTTPKSVSRVAASPKPAPPAAAPPATASASPEPVATPKPGRKNHAIMIESEMTYGEFATKHGTDIKRLNELNGLDLTKGAILAKGSELYVPPTPP